MVHANPTPGLVGRNTHTHTVFTQCELIRTGEGNKCQSSKGRYRANQRVSMTPVVNKLVCGEMCTALNTA